MALQLYKKKRDFKKTPEPKGKPVPSKSKLSFVVQRHKASHLHYDFRLELDGVLKSWAVPKGPSLNPNDKRLAMMVEDHPYDYKDFAGVIPEGNYGAGIVEVWDKGYYSDIGNSPKNVAEKRLRAGLHAGSLKFRLHGKKLKGEFALVKLKGKGDNSWLLIKHRDEFSVSEAYNSEDETPVNSPINVWLRKHGRNGTQKRSSKKKEARAKEPVAETLPLRKGRRYLPAESRKLHDYIKPMLARETDAPFSDREWIYEIKWDGYRAIAEVNDKKVRLYSRNGNTFNESYPVVVYALEHLGINAVLDGEIVVIGDDGKPSFQLLQHYGNNQGYPILYYVFDVLELNGQNTCDLPLTERKQLLENLLPKKDHVVKYSGHIPEEGIKFFEAAKENDLEGIIAKKADSFYFPGMRSSEWLKIKHHKTSEAIVTGFTEPTGGRKHFGALVLGIYREGKLRYAGHTGSGFNTQSLKETYERLKPLARKDSPFEEKVKTNMPVTWVDPTLVCEIKFTEWTRDGKMRHPIFMHLRDDKKASQVTYEAEKPVHVKSEKKPGNRKQETGNTKPKKSIQADKENTVKYGKINVKVSNLEKVFWPEEGYTKGDVINYYRSVARYILPYLKGRPQSLLRNPGGINDPGFYQKDAGDKAPEWVKSIPIHSESSDKDIDYILCDDEPTLVYLANLGCIEINPWHSTVKALDHPDYIVIDIDPSKDNTFNQVIESALVIRDVLKKAGINGYCKTSGATGLHVYIPTAKKYTYDQLKDFSHLICMIAQQELPDFTTLERNLKKRGSKHIYLDYLQNRRGQTVSSVYSLRPKPGAPVSMPLDWREVKPGLSPLDFNIENALKRIQKKGDLFKHVLGKGIDLMKCLKKLDK